MKDSIINSLVKFRSLTFIQILQRTMVSLFPVALVGSICWVLNQSFLTRDSFFGRITDISSWFPAYRVVGTIVGDVQIATTGLIAIYAAYVSSELTIRHYGKKSIIVGISSVATYVLIFLHSVRNNTIEMSYYSGYWLIVGVIVGYFVGLIFAKTGHGNIKQTRRNDILVDIFSNIVPLLITLGIALVLHVGYFLYRNYQADQIIRQSITSVANQHSSYGLSIVISLLSTISLWCGYGGTINFNNSIFNNESVANLSYALSHKTAWGIPYPYTLNALYGGLAEIGGTGAMLALIIAVALISKNKQRRRIAYFSAFPTFFDSTMPVAFGMPTILNPVYFIPFVFSPIINMLLGTAAIALKLFPPLVYLLPTGTPGILGPLMGTGGNINALIFSIFLVVVDTLIYIPFIKLANEVEQRYQESVVNNEN